jgi:ATP-dependent DNA helicase RecG
LIRAGDQAQLEGEIVTSKILFGRQRSLQCGLLDSSGIVNLRFFHFSAAQKKSLQPGTKIRCFGEVRRGRNGIEIYHPEYKILRPGEDLPVSKTLTPIYPATEGLQQTRLRNIIQQALVLLESTNSVKDYLPASLIAELKMPSLIDAIKLIHQPPLEIPLDWINNGMNQGQRRLAFEELLANRLCMRRFKLQSNQQNAPAFNDSDKLLSPFLKQLPFKLTNGQQKAFLEIEQDLNQSHPMLRMLQGDVGSGKTVVAALSCLKAIGNSHQVALMAPTELLAEQHHINFCQWLEPLGINVGWLSGKSKGSLRSQQLESLEDGSCQLIIGTHALFQEGVNYKRLGLIIIDEQHRFGVHQRLALREKATVNKLSPHQLVMTATPIPRTLAMSAYADLDCTIIDELPPGRTPVNTAVISSERRESVTERIEKSCANNNQAYWVCTLIEESETLQCQAAEVTAEQLTIQLPNIRVGLIHGRMKPKEKSDTMEQFKSGDIQLLVATTVIEVGVDVPNASLMVIENPERLGLAQLHQLRGRIGRGPLQSHCILLYQTPLSNAGKQRLGVMRKSNDGFYIAEKDLELRGPGQVLGTQQTGLMSFKIADIGRDSSLLDSVRDTSEQIMQLHPEIIDPLIQRWLGDRVNYVNV